MVDDDEGLHKFHLGNKNWERFLSYGLRPVYSPDGSQIAFMDGQSCLCIIPADGKPEDVRTLAYFEGQYNPKTKEDWRRTCTNPIWSPDGRFLWVNLTYSARKRTLCTLLQQFGTESTTRMIAEDGKEWRNSLSYMLENTWNGAGLYSHHRVGVIDLEEGTVWIGEGEWNDLSWCPVKE